MQLFHIKKHQLRNEKWNVNYWRPDYLLLIEEAKKIKFSIKSLGEISDIQIGKSGKRYFIKLPEVRYITVGDILPTGINFSNKPKWIKREGFNDTPKSRIIEGDIMVVIGGSIGKVSIAYDINEDLNVSQDIALVRPQEAPLYSTFLFLQSKWGLAQIFRLANGTGIYHLSTDELKSIIVPIFDENFEEWCKEEMESIKDLHRTAIQTDDKKDWEALKKRRKELLTQFHKKMPISKK